jgi:DNA topoisomerase-1
LIVESPAKARTLERYLGKDFAVKASVGHIKDLPSNKLGIDLENNFQPDYKVIIDKRKVIAELKQAAADAEEIFLGPDPDREGEAIAWHIAEEIGSPGKLTRKGILEAISHPLELNKPRYEAQQARRLLDRIVGYQISPLLWEKVKKGLSAGRVQSVALRLVCDREREIRKFDPVEYWTVTGAFAAAPPEGAPGEPKPFEAQLLRCGKKKCKISSAEESESVVEGLRPLSYRVEKVERKKRRRNPAPPFITSTLQQEAARKARFSARKTMSVAQRLYEGIELGEEGAVGLITYMRTDSTRISEDAVASAREYIEKSWGKPFLPAKPAIYKAREGAQDAHEAIRPTDVSRTPEVVASFLSREQLTLYSLVWKRFIACQMASAVISQTVMDISGGDFVFRVSGSVIDFPGFMTLYVEGRDEDSEEEGGKILPDLAEGRPLSLLEVTPKQHFTQPPPRFSEASLIKELEERGVGRPSTYAAILSTIVDREYVKSEKQRLQPTELGVFISDLLVRHFPDIMDVEFTAKMEKGLDEVEGGHFGCNRILEEFYRPFAKTLEAAQGSMVNMKMTGWPTDHKCPKCASPLRIKWSRNGPFVACESYPECSFTSDYERDEKGAIKLVTDKTTDEKCEKCGSPMLLKHGRFGAFLACSSYPKCKNTRPVGMGVACPREGCGGEIVERVSKKGRRFYGCSRYPDCDITFWTRPVRKDCPQCGGKTFVEKKARNGDVKYICANPSCAHVIEGDAAEEGSAAESK